MLSRDEFYKELSNLIRTRRKQLNLTNESIFAISGVDLSKVSTLQNYNSNKNTGCTAYTLYKILLALNIDLFKPNKDINTLLFDNIKELEKIVKSLKNI